MKTVFYLGKVFDFSLRVMLILSLSLPAFTSNAQNIKPGEKEALAQQAPVFKVFEAGHRSGETDYGQDLKRSRIIQLNSEIVKELKSFRQKSVAIELPTIDGGENWTLQLTRTQIFDQNFAVYLSSDRNTPYDYKPGTYFFGYIEGIPGSKVAISVFDEEIAGLILTKEENFNLMRVEKGRSEHILFAESDLTKPQPLVCGMDNMNQETGTMEEEDFDPGRAFGNCLRIYLELGFSVNQTRGGVDEAINFGTSIFHQSKLLYNDESVDKVLSQVFVWDAVDPYDGITDTEDIRNTFQANTPVLDGDLGQLLVVNGSGTGAGGIAAFVGNGLTNANVANKLCITSMGSGTAFAEYPAYSRIVKVFAHELGHLLNCAHTHACRWNGDDTQIDDYGNVNPDGTVVTDDEGDPNAEGLACLDEMNPLLGVTPTLMSYFDSFGHGTFALGNGFGTQPGDRMRAAVALALAGDDIEENCTAPFNDLCAGAQTLICGEATYAFTETATNTDAPAGCGLGGLPSIGVWFTFEGNGQVITLNTDGSDFDTQINLYSGTCGSLTCLDGDDDSGTGLSSLLTFCTTNGVTYFVYVDGFSTQIGNVEILLTCINDVTPPDITCPFGVVVFNELDECGNNVLYASAQATDLCGIASIVHSQNSGTFFPVGITTVIATATDGRGNQNTCSFDVEVIDSQDPEITCMDISVSFNGEEEIVIDIPSLATAEDNCPDAEITLDIPVLTCENIGDVIPVTATVTDASGNTAQCVSMVTIEGLPCGWSQHPDGINCPAGNLVEYDAPTEEFTVNSTNCFYGPPYNSDVMAYASHELCGTGAITALVTSFKGNFLGWAGVTIRENEMPGARKVQLMTNLSNFSKREIRTIVNGSSYPQQFPSYNRYWLRITRSGNQFFGYVSPNGSNWFQAFATMVNMPECVEVGLVVANYSANSLVSATFTNVEVTEGMLPLIYDGDLSDAIAGTFNKIDLYPNPSSGIVYMSIPNPEDDLVNINIKDALGRIVFSSVIENQLNQILELNLSHLPSGMYFLNYGNSPNMQMKKIILHSGE
jgi:hypothetical protein